MMNATTLIFGSMLIALASTPSFAQAGDQKRVCAVFDDAIENFLKLIASDRAEGTGDSSAPRATLRELKINNHLKLVTMNLQLRAQNGCPPSKGPILIGKYLAPALECKTDLLKLQLGKEVAKSEGSALPLSCDMATWKPSQSNAGAEK